MTRADRRTLVRQLAGEGLSQRQIAARLGISKDTVRRDLETIASHDEPQDEPPGAPDVPEAPQVSGAVQGDGAPRDEPPSADAPAAAPPGAPPAETEPRVAHGGALLVVALDDSPGLAEDLALLQEAGADAAEVVNFAVDRLATAYRTARGRGWLRPGQAFDVVQMQIKPAAGVRRPA
ncbi:MAG: HTH domain-containing protein [Streptomyces sp.]|nr:HTH domain-containing protein [Streptomyces sp.]